MDFFKKYKRIFIITLTIVCIAMVIVSIGFRYNPTLIESAIGYVVTPFQSAFTSVGKWTSEKISVLSNIKYLEEENTRLKAEVDSLSAENKRLKLIEEENVKLASLLNISSKYPDYPTVGARIIAKDTGNWYNTFIIDKGSRDGINKNMVVLASKGLVGRILETGATYSKVVALIDDTSAISAKSVRTEDIGILKGDMMLMRDGLCLMDYIDMDAEIMAGDELVTSHLSDIYPPGLLIGNVTLVSVDTAGFSKKAVVKPVVDFKHMEEVLVITEVFKDMAEVEREELENQKIELD